MKLFSRTAVEVQESFLMAMTAVVTHKLRSALTMLGVAIGVFSIIVVMTTMRAMEKNIEQNFAQLGSGTFTVSTLPGLQFNGPNGNQDFLRRKHITLEQGRELIKRATLPRNIGLQADMGRGPMTSVYSQGPPNVSLIGETPGGFPARNWTVSEGRALVDADLDYSRDVIVLASSLAEQLFPHSSAVGQDIMAANGVKYTVVGVMDPNGTSPGGLQDNFGVIPLTTGLTRYYVKQSVNLSIFVETASPEMYDDTMDEVRGIMRVLRKVPPGMPDDFEMSSNDSMIQQFQSFTFKVRLGVTLISSVALLAAGVGIMNIMLVSVTERTREIGIRRAIGAKRRNIMAQFIMEAIVLCEIGGVIGVAMGVAGGGLAAKLLKITAVVPMDWVMIGLGICSLVGIIFGTYPAHKAANLDPIESLRYE